MLKHGFIIIAHSYLEQLDKIIEELSFPNHYFFINIDRKNVDASNFMKRYENRCGVCFLKGKERMEVAHAGYSMVECTLKLLRLAMKNGMDYYHLMSGLDFPCRSNMEFDDFFQKHMGTSYMLMDSDNYRQECMERKYLSRIKPWYFYDVPYRNIGLVDMFVRFSNRISRKIWWRKDITELWGAWQWFSWYKTVAEYVVSEEKNNPSFFKRFHHTSCSDELIFATLLYRKREQLKIVADNSLRYINWEKEVEGRKQKNHPLILNEDDYEDILKSGAFFCRKVNPTISSKLLVLLEKRKRRFVNDFN